MLGILNGLGREIVLHNDRGIEGCEVDLVDRLVYARIRLEDHATFVAVPQLGDVPVVFCISLAKGHCYSPAQRLEDLVAGDKCAGREAGREVRREAGEPGGHEDALQAALGIDEAPGGVYEYPALGDESALFVAHLSIAPVGPGGHRLEEAAAADGALQAVSFGLADNDGNPGVGKRTQDQVRIMGFDEIQKVTKNHSLCSLQPSLASILDLNAADADIPGQRRITAKL